MKIDIVKVKNYLLKQRDKTKIELARVIGLR
jgi:hypothetical protein